VEKIGIFLLFASFGLKIMPQLKTFSKKLSVLVATFEQNLMF